MAVLQQRDDEETPAAPPSGSLRVDAHARELLAGWDPFCVTRNRGHNCRSFRGYDGPTTTPPRASACRVEPYETTPTPVSSCLRGGTPSVSSGTGSTTAAPSALRWAHGDTAASIRSRSGCLSHPHLFLSLPPARDQSPGLSPSPD
jgi:hypothetical protein